MGRTPPRRNNIDARRRVTAAKVSGTASRRHTLHRTNPDELDDNAASLRQLVATYVDYGGDPADLLISHIDFIARPTNTTKHSLSVRPARP